jgi:hypothetical protein
MTTTLDSSDEHLGERSDFASVFNYDMTVPDAFEWGMFLFILN